MVEPSDEELVRRWLNEGCPSWGAPIDSIRRQSQEIDRLRQQMIDQLREVQQRYEGENERLRGAFDNMQQRANDLVDENERLRGDNNRIRDLIEVLYYESGQGAALEPGND